MRRLLLIPAFVFASAALAGTSTLEKPPVAPKRATFTVTHGDTLRDNYFWMREKEDPAVKAYLEAENAFTGMPRVSSR